MTQAQLVGAGVSPSTIDRWIRAGRLTRIHREVYALGHATLSPDGRRLAAVLACGATAHMGEHDGGAIHNLCFSRGADFVVFVQPNRARGGRRPGIRVRESRMTPDDVTVVRGIPVTSVERTIVDIAARTPSMAEEVIDAAIRLGTYDQAAMDRQLMTHRRGVAVVRAALIDRHPDSHDTKSGWERAMLRLVRIHDLPSPQVNPDLVDLGLSPDLLWPAERVVVEWDSWEHHHTRSRFESDRMKTIRLQDAGYTVRRFTWRQTQEQPEVVAASIRSALRRTARDTR